METKDFKWIMFGSSQNWSTHISALVKGFGQKSLVDQSRHSSTRQPEPQDLIADFSMHSQHSPSSVSTASFPPLSPPSPAASCSTQSRRRSSGDRPRPHSRSSSRPSISSRGRSSPEPEYASRQKSPPSVGSGSGRTTRRCSVDRSRHSSEEDREQAGYQDQVRSLWRGRRSDRSRISQRGRRTSRSRSPRRRRHASRSRSSRRRKQSRRSRSSQSRPSGRSTSLQRRSSRSSNATRERRSQIPTQHLMAAASADAIVVRSRRTVVHVGGHAFTRYSPGKTRTSYRCSSYRSTKCKAKLHFNHKENEYEFHGEHSCKSGRRDVLPPGLDVSENMKEATDMMVLTRMDLTAERVWKKIRDDFYPEELMLVQYGLTREQVIQRVHRTRRSHFGADLHGVVEVPPLSLVLGTNLPFFQFYRSYMNGSTLERLVGWAHLALIKLLKYKCTTLFLDGTFRCAPHPFYQCVVMMVFDNATDLFVPVFFTLCTAKTQDTYWHLMEAVNVAADDKIEPSIVVCDFEEGLQAAAQVQFQDADIVGCYFHFKQACRRKMKALGIPETETNIAMRKEVLDMLTAIPHEKIEGPGIRYVQDKIRGMCMDENVTFTASLWELFWSYFRNTWLKTYKPSVWNVHDVDKVMVSRTNNPLERFNREINCALPAPHPALPAFVAMIQVLSQRYVDRIADMEKCRAKKRRRRNIEPVNLPVPVALGGDVDESTTKK